MEPHMTHPGGSTPASMVSETSSEAFNVGLAWQDGEQGGPGQLVVKGG